MSDIPRSNRARIDAFMDDINSRDATRLALMRAIFAMYETMDWTVRHVYEVAPARVVYFHETVGTLKGGEPYTNQVVTLIDFDEDGRIAYLSDYFKCTAKFTPPEGLAPIHPEPEPPSR